MPLLTFWQAFDIKPNASIRVEYTTDPVDSTPDNWTAIPNQGVLIDYTNPSGAGRTSLTMQPVSIDLTNIPVWNSSTFRLRFALYVQPTATEFGEGWYIDDIKIERESQSPYFAYPFVDNAESAANTAAWWDKIGNRWGATTEKGGAQSSATAYSDSPLSDYDQNDTQDLQLHYAIDLNHDTPSNANPGSAAVNPVLTFWHQRNVGAGVKLEVDLWTVADPTWTNIWQYNSDDATYSNFRLQRAWERVEINLVTALEAKTGKTWANIVGNADSIVTDDDIKVRFRFTSGGSPASDGVYVDEIHIEDLPLPVHDLWDSGDGPYVDGISGAWQSTWYGGGQWGTTSAAGYTYGSGGQSLTDSPSGNYADNTFSVLELKPIIDLNAPGGYATDQLPKLTFWTRYEIGNNDEFRVDIAYRDSGTAGNASNYNQIGGWSAWTAQPVMLDNSGSTSADGLQSRHLAARRGRFATVRGQADSRALRRQRAQHHQSGGWHLH